MSTDTPRYARCFQAFESEIKTRYQALYEACLQNPTEYVHHFDFSDDHEYSTIEEWLPHSSFGKKFKRRVIHRSSRTVEDWIYRLHETVCKEHTVYVLDSVNALADAIHDNIRNTLVTRFMPFLSADYMTTQVATPIPALDYTFADTFDVGFFEPVEFETMTLPTLRQDAAQKLHGYCSSIMDMFAAVMAGYVINIPNTPTPDGRLVPNVIPNENPVPVTWALAELENLIKEVQNSVSKYMGTTVVADLWGIQSIYAMEVPEGCEVTVEFITGYGTAQARNKAACKAVDEKFDYILFVDSDQILPPDTLRKLLNCEVDIASGWCMMAVNDNRTNVTMYNAEANHYWDFISVENMPEGIITVDGVGFACVLVKTSVLERMPYPYFQYVEYANRTILSEDLYFCDVARRNGIVIKCDCSLKVEHIKTIVI